MLLGIILLFNIWITCVNLRGLVTAVVFPADVSNSVHSYTVIRCLTWVVDEKCPGIVEVYEIDDATVSVWSLKRRTGNLWIEITFWLLLMQLWKRGQCSQWTEPGGHSSLCWYRSL